MRSFLKSLCFISFGFVAATALAQNGNYSSYYTYTVSWNSDGSANLTPTTEVTGIDDYEDDWAENGYRPICSVATKAQVTGDAAWVHGSGAPLGRNVDGVHTGQPVHIPADGSTVNLQFAVEADVHCSRPAGGIHYYQYPNLSAFNTWSGIDPSIWALLGFEPPETNPPLPNTYCPNPESCPVGTNMAAIPNFVDFADFSEVTIRTAVSTYAISTVNATGSVTYNLSCPNGNQSATCGAAHYLGSQAFLWAEEYQLYTQPGGCFPLGFVQYKNGPPAPYPCT